MAASKKRLGRGLGSLISGGVGKDNPESPTATEAAGKAAAKPAPAKKTAAKKGGSTAGKRAAAPAPAPNTRTGLPEYEEIEIGRIDPNPFQPRRDIDPGHIEELAASIRSEGLLQPIVVRRGSSNGRFELIAGERRWRAFQSLKQKRIPARVIQASDASSASLALIENLQREGLNPIEEAHGYASLIRDFDLTQEAAAERVGKGRATVANALRLLGLEPEIQGYVSKGLLSTGHAKVLLGLEQADHRRLMAKRIIEAGLSVRATELEIKRLRDSGRRSKSASGTGSTGQESAAVQDLERRLTSALNTRVALQHHPKKGRIVIEYHGNDDLQRILEKMGVD